MPRRFRIGLPKMHRRFHIGPPESGPPEMHRRGILMYPVYYVRKALKKPNLNIMANTVSILTERCPKISELMIRRPAYLISKGKYNGAQKV